MSSQEGHEAGFPDDRMAWGWHSLGSTTPGSYTLTKCQSQSVDLRSPTRGDMAQRPTCVPHLKNLELMGACDRAG